MAGAASFFSFVMLFFTVAAGGGGGAGCDDSAGTSAAAAFGGGFAAFIALGLVTRAGLLSAGGAAPFDWVGGGAKISSAALMLFFFVPPPVGSVLAKRFCWVSVSIMFGGALAFGTDCVRGGADFLAILLFT